MSKIKFTPDPAASEPPAAPATGPGGKLGLMVALMRRPEGADISDMMTATGWQQHSVRGALAGALKRGHRLDIVSEKVGTARIYRIRDPEPELARPPRAKRQPRTTGAAQPVAAAETLND